MDAELEKYCISHSDEEPEILRKLNRDGHVNLLKPRMMSGHYQGRVLAMLSKMIGPRRILEIGTFAGYSALCFAEGLTDDGLIYTLDVNDEIEEFASRYFEQSVYKDKIKFIIADVEQWLPTVDEEFDLVFIDGNKRHYDRYYEAVLPRVRKGGFILADNTLWDGKVLEPVQKNDTQTQGILSFNDLVARDNRVEKLILPLRDGLTLIRKK